MSGCSTYEVNGTAVGVSAKPSSTVSAATTPDTLPDPAAEPETEPAGAAEPTMTAVDSDKLACLDLSRWLKDSVDVLDPGNPAIEEDRDGYSREVQDIADAGHDVTATFAHRPHTTERIDEAAAAMDDLADEAAAGGTYTELVLAGKKVTRLQQGLSATCADLIGS